MYKLAYRSLFRKSSMLRKLLLSMICLICVPLILIQVFTIQRSTTEFTESQHTQTMSFLQSMDAAFEEHIDAFSAYSVKIASTEEVKYPLQADAEEYELYLAASKIKEYDSVYPLIKSVGVYYPSTDRVVCNGYCYKLSDFISLYYSDSCAGYEAFVGFFGNMKDTAFFSTGEYAGSQLSQLIFARSVPVGGGIAENATVFFTIEDKSLKNWCAGFLAQSSGFAITTAAGDVLLHTGTLSSGILQDEDYAAFAADLNQHMFTLNDADDTLIYKYQSPESAFVIFAAMPQNVINENVNQYMLQVRIALILTVLVTVIFTAITAYINYKPIIELLYRHAPAGNDTAESELDLLDSAFFLRDEQINSQDNLIRTFIISDMLTGVPVDKKKMERFFPKSEHLFFSVSLTDIVFPTAQISAMIERAAQMYDMKLLITTLPQRKETIFIIFSHNKEGFVAREEKLNQIVLYATGFECAFISGCIVNNIRNVEQSYKDAIQNYYKATEQMRIAEPYPTQLVQEFGNCIRRNNLDEALTLLEQVRAKQNACGPLYQKLIGFDMLRTYIHNVSEDENEELESMLFSENVPLILAYLHSAIAKRQRSTEIVNKDINKELKDLLIDYVNKNCLSSTICLTSAADYMNTSIYTVSRLFKEATGMGFKDYITSRRLKHACHLLKTTSLSVNAIATECGFERIAYFSTIFKNEYGVAPSVYRANH